MATWMREDAGTNIAASQSVANLLFVGERKPRCLYRLLGCTDQLLARRSAIGLATLTFKPTYSILCGLSTVAPLVLPPPQPQAYSLPSYTCRYKLFLKKKTIIIIRLDDCVHFAHVQFSLSAVYFIN